MEFACHPQSGLKPGRFGIVHLLTSTHNLKDQLRCPLTNPRSYQTPPLRSFPSLAKSSAAASTVLRSLPTLRVAPHPHSSTPPTLHVRQLLLSCSPIPPRCGGEGSQAPAEKRPAGVDLFFLLSPVQPPAGPYHDARKIHEGASPQGPSLAQSEIPSGALLAGFERRPDLPGVVSTCSLKLRRYLLIGRWWEGAVGDSAPARVDGV